MNLYRESTINIISFFISIVIFFLLEFFIFYFSEPTLKIQANFNSTVSEQQEIDTSNEIKQVTEEVTNTIQTLPKDQSSVEMEKQNSNWYLEIPVIGLSANIAEGTDKEVMEAYIGHFEETSKLIGNVGLAAHNRGYLHNYFEHLKDLKIGDEIRYYYQGQEKRYVVEKQKIIQDTDWTMLENTQDNRLTLITCVENEPSYRRCVQAVEF